MRASGGNSASVSLGMLTRVSPVALNSTHRTNESANAYSTTIRGGPVTLAAACLILSSCVTAPQQTIDLSDVVAEQSSALETSHRNLADAYFGELERQIDDFVDRRWAPDFLARAAGSEQVQNAIGRVQSGLGIDPNKLRTTVTNSGQFSSVESDVILKALEAAKFDYRAQFGQIMLDFSSEALRQINIVRADLKRPIQDSRRELIGVLNEGYSNLNAGQAAVRAYLVSVADVVEEQDRVLEKLELLEASKRALDAAIKAGEQATHANKVIQELDRNLNEISDGSNQ